jgi:hypothetical protein
MYILFLLLLYGMQIGIFIRVRHGKKYFDLPDERRDV